MKNILLVLILATNVLTAQPAETLYGRLSLKNNTWFLHINEGRKELPQITYQISNLPFDRSRKALSGLIVKVMADFADCGQKVACLNVKSLEASFVDPLSDSDKVRITKLLKK